MRILVAPRQLAAAIRRHFAAPPPPPAIDPYDLPAFTEVEVCRGCGCTELRACPGGCWWVGRGLCSRCIPTFGGTD